MTAKPGRARDLWLFALAAGCAAFLIFLVQPLVGKRLLPWFGGAPAVWALCLAFYQTTLFAGYAYAHGLRKLGRPRLELVVHGALLALAAWVLPVLPDDAWRPASDAQATRSILLALTANVALPFVFLAATGPLVQSWFAAAHPDRSPYFLYAISNTGSMLALFAYPTLIEPNLGLAATGGHWSLSFVIVGLAVLGCGVRAAWRPLAAAPPVEGSASDSQPQWVEILHWIALSGVAVVLLMGFTNQLCLDVASVPFLWVLPLAIYLLTFILCFASERFHRPLPFTLVAFVAAFSLPYVDSSIGSGDGRTPAWLPVTIAVYSLLLFCCCMVLHGELYRRRPQPAALTAYYLWISAGGALGGLFVGIAAQRLFDNYHEVPLGLAAWALLALLALASPATHRRRLPLWRGALALGLVAGLAYFAYYAYHVSNLFSSKDVIHRERSFFGVLSVLEDPKLKKHTLRHGTTVHGVQLMRGEGGHWIPTTYYGRLTGIGFALRERRSSGPLRVATVGLGAGTLAAYGRPGDLFRFYEIDEAVTRLARDPDYFRYLNDSLAEIEVVERDGRLALDEERKQGEAGWDVLILDAFSSDAIPVHLLTREALMLYAERLAPDGLLALHVSNRHFDLESIGLRLAAELGLQAMTVINPEMPRRGTEQAIWILLAKTADPLLRVEQLIGTREARQGVPLRLYRVRWSRPEKVADTTLWTDDYSDLFRALRKAPQEPGEAELPAKAEGDRAFAP